MFHLPFNTHGAEGRALPRRPEIEREREMEMRMEKKGEKGGVRVGSRRDKAGG